MTSTQPDLLKTTEMTTTQPGLLEATDEIIDGAVRYADPMVLRGLVYQLTGDESLGGELALTTKREGLVTKKIITDPAQKEFIFGKAAEFLKACRDAGPHQVSCGPRERLHTSLNLATATNIPDDELEMWIEQLGIDRFSRGLTWSATPDRELLENFSVLVIGAGMGGLNAAVHLSNAGIPHTILEKNDDVGGTWYHNRYPGARVDTPSRIYSHTFGTDFSYSAPYSERSENEDYVRWIADHFDLRGAIRFGTEVKSMVWDDETSLWTVTADGPDGEEVWRANAIISAVGFLSRPAVPKIEGIEEFEGSSFHTSQWPESLDVTGKRVAVVGSGCTGYQLVAELARRKEAEHIYLYQRTPNWVFETPGYLSDYPSQIKWLDRNFPYFSNFMRLSVSWNRRPSETESVAANKIDPSFKDPHAVSAANKLVREQRLEFMESKLGDRPDLLEAMLPVAPVLSARPVLVDQDYSIYDALLEDNVTLVPAGLTEVTEDSVVSGNGEKHEVDVIALATGFRANDFLWPMEVRGRQGARMEDLWSKDGARAYLGTMVPEFPNFFMLYGPNTNANVGFAAVHMEELVTRFALECIDALITRNKRAVEVTSEAYWRFNDALDEAASTQVYLDPRAQNYYTNEFGRSASNGAFDSRLLWHWLRDPRTRNRVGQATPSDSSTYQQLDVIAPYIDEDLLLS